MGYGNSLREFLDEDIPTNSCKSWEMLKYHVKVLFHILLEDLEKGIVLKTGSTVLYYLWHFSIFSVLLFFNLYLSQLSKPQIADIFSQKIGLTYFTN